MNRAVLPPAALALLLSPLFGAAAFAQKPFNPTLPYPGEVALADEAEKGYVYRRFPGSARLYTYDLDGKGKSACNKGCDGQRRPVLARARNPKPLGDWSLVKRYDGTNQWAYKGRPVYTLYHDTPEGSGETAQWHLLPYEK